MKKQSWLGVLENVSLLGLGVGSIATIVLKEILYTTTPLSLLMVLGLFDRRRFEEESHRRSISLAETDQKLSNRLEAVIQHVANLPTVDMIQQTRQGLILKDREVARRLYSEITALQQELNQRLHPLEQQGLTSTRQELNQLGAQYNQLSEAIAHLGVDLRLLETLAQSTNSQEAIAQLQSGVANLQHNLDTLSNQTKPNLASLQEQISRLDRQLGKLPPPVDLTSLKQEVGELIRIISELVPRRDLLALVNEVRELHRQQERLKRSVEAIETAAIRSIRPPSNSQAPNAEEAALLAAQLAQQPDPVLAQPSDSPTDPATDSAAELKSIQSEAVNYLTHLRSQLATVQTFTESLAAQHQELQAQLDQLPTHPDVARLQEQLQALAQRIPAAETTLDTFRNRIQDVIQQELLFITEQLQATTATPSYEFVFDLNSPPETSPSLTASTLAGSRAILEETLDSTQNRLILILPWSDCCTLDAALLQRLEAFLNQGKQLHIGWCQLADRNEERLLKKMRRGWSSSQPDPIQNTLHQLLQLKRTYPQTFQFKILGTSENFLVSDQAFAVLGIADTLRTNTAFSELQLKLKTREPEVIQRLTNCFDHPTLDHDDLPAYWNRGVTRHDLGDKLGAIADYSQILSFDPNDFITYNYRGSAYYEAGNIAAAIADLSQSIHLNPQQAVAYCNRGFIRFEQGDPAAAIADYTQALQNQPDWAILYFYRGMAWQKLENYQEAIGDYGEAIYLAPDSAVAHYYRGLAGQKLRNYQGAIADLEAATSLFAEQGSSTNAQKAQKSLTKLRNLLAQLNREAVTQDEQPKKLSPERTPPDFGAIATRFTPTNRSSGGSNGSNGGGSNGNHGSASLTSGSLPHVALDFYQLFNDETLN
ncbi:tetratricopeptide repeat protein [Phormidium tenue FACHB-886]|nr:tetratricopeptide repeat protein [Phormidium tenue FACHB-886]